jgi:hypothetical protein
VVGAGRVPLLQIVHPDCLRVFELNLSILSGAKNVPELGNANLGKPGAFTKVKERSTFRDELDELTKLHFGSAKHLHERLVALEQKPLPADVRVLSDRIDRQKERFDELKEQCADFVDEETLEREINEMRDSLVEYKRETTRRFDRAERDIERLEAPRRDHPRTR